MPFSLRSFTFNAPSKGKAEVTFHGSLYCANADNGKTVDFTTQITTANESAARAAGPGGMRQAETFTNNQSTTFNLASTRVLTLTKAGNVTVDFRAKSNRFDAGITCFLYNAAFSVNFVP